MIEKKIRDNKKEKKKKNGKEMIKLIIIGIYLEQVIKFLEK